ncbi:MAG TPA: tRNA pseudouridine(38-40) synthase TruA [Pyrinomonadaceae bacterium]|nr:tRNA pseudouridine(38-40) synthase TruA [Pyrinomonadaceae bacterium]
MARNYKLLLQYDGTDFHGWQIQEGLRTVQGELTSALSLIDGRSVNVHGSGRTDAGVHAEGQVASVEIEREITPEKLRLAINGNVGKDVRVLAAEVVPPEFHARYSALGKTYVYRIVNGPVISPFWSRYAHQEARKLDLDRMRSAAELFLGRHDWTAFSATQSDVEDRVRTITQLDIGDRFDERAHDSILEIRVTADGFLRYMVRAIAGTLMAAARNELDTDAIAEAISTGRRPLAATTAPACGLTLVSVRYS